MNPILLLCVVSHCVVRAVHFVDNELETIAHDRNYGIEVTDRHGNFVRSLANNMSQTRAIRSAMCNRLSLIQGPPG